MLQCRPDSEMVAMVILGVPVVVVLIGAVIWYCYGKARYQSSLLKWRDAIRARLVYVGKRSGR